MRFLFLFASPVKNFSKFQKRTFFKCVFNYNTFLSKVIDDVNNSLSLGNFDEALNLIQQANLPDHKYILMEKEADILVIKQEYSKAIDIYSEIIENDTNQNPKGLQSLYIRLGDCSLSIEDYNSALKSYMRAIRAFPQASLPLER